MIKDPCLMSTYLTGMRITFVFNAAFAVFLLLCNVTFSQEVKLDTESLPQLRTVGGITQLYVDGKPFLGLGGELGNSTASDLAVLDTALQKCKAYESEHDYVAGLLEYD